MRYQLGSKTYVNEAICKVHTLLKDAGIDVPFTQNVPLPEKYQPEMDETPLCSAKEHTLYMQLIGIYLWIALIGRVDIAFAVSSLSRFSSAPRRNHLKRATDMIGYLEKHPDRRLVVDARPMETIPGTPLRTDKSEMKHLYPDAIDCQDVLTEDVFRQDVWP